MGSTAHDPHAGHGGHDEHAGHSGHGGDSALGLERTADGYRFGEVSAPSESGTAGTLSFAITGPDGTPVTDFTEEHEKKLHLIAARSDGAHFAHVHPTLAGDGTWSVPWEWATPGNYRLFADFIPSATGSGLTLSTVVRVAGDFAPEPASPHSETSVGGYDVAVRGSLAAGQPSPLEFAISRDGEPVTALEPYLGAFGHLVALRDGDLAYLHVHPHGDAPQPGETSGPLITFEATAPTPGRYLLFLDFQVAGEVFTAELVLDTVE